MPLPRGEAVALEGEFHHVTGQVATPGAQAPAVLLAALGPVMLRVAGELADGTVTVRTGVRTVATHIVPRITAAAEAAGRPAPRVVVNLPVAVTGDAGGARAWVAEHFGAAGRVPGTGRCSSSKAQAVPRTSWSPATSGRWRAGSAGTRTPAPRSSSPCRSDPMRRSPGP
jgi:hypothetical protein